MTTSSRTQFFIILFFLFIFTFSSKAQNIIKKDDIILKKKFSVVLSNNSSEEPDADSSWQPTGSSADKVSEIGPASNDHVKAKLETEFLITLSSSPSSRGIIINYGSAKDIAKRVGIMRNFFASRAIDLGRIRFVTGKNQPQIKSLLYVNEPGQPDPIP